MAMFNSYVKLQEGIGFDAFPLVRATELLCFTQVAIARNVDCGGSGGEAGGTLEVHLPRLDFR
jgi:hypothetical protein